MVPDRFFSLLSSIGQPEKDVALFIQELEELIASLDEYCRVGGKGVAELHVLLALALVLAEQHARDQEQGPGAPGTRREGQRSPIGF
jgi:hypothetical protein